MDAASDLSEKDRMLKEKEAEVLNWFETISFYSLPRNPTQNDNENAKVPGVLCKSLGRGVPLEK